MMLADRRLKLNLTKWLTSKFIPKRELSIVSVDNLKTTVRYLCSFWPVLSPVGVYSRFEQYLLDVWIWFPRPIHSTWRSVTQNCLSAGHGVDKALEDRWLTNLKNVKRLILGRFERGTLRACLDRYIVDLRHQFDHDRPIDIHKYNMWLELQLNHHYNYRLRKCLCMLQHLSIHQHRHCNQLLVYWSMNNLFYNFFQLDLYLGYSLSFYDPMRRSISFFD